MTFKTFFLASTLESNSSLESTNKIIFFVVSLIAALASSAALVYLSIKADCASTVSEASFTAFTAPL